MDFQRLFYTNHEFENRTFDWVRLIFCKKRTRKTCFDGLALGLLFIGLPEPIERNPFNCVRLSSVSEPNRTQSDGLSSIEFD